MNQEVRNNNERISLFEASELSGLHQDYLRFLCRTGKIEGKKIGRNWTTTARAVQKYLEQGLDEAGLQMEEEVGALAQLHYDNINLTSPNEANETILTTTGEEKAGGSEAVSETQKLNVEKLVERPMASPRVFNTHSTKLQILVPHLHKVHEIVYKTRTQILNFILFAFLVYAAVVLVVFSIQDAAVHSVINWSAYQTKTLSPQAETAESGKGNFVGGRDVDDGISTPSHPSVLGTNVQVEKKTGAGLSATLEYNESYFKKLILQTLQDPEVKMEFKGEKGERGEKGDKGDTGIAATYYVPSSPASLPAITIPGAIVQPNPQTGYSGSTLFAAREISAEKFMGKDLILTGSVTVQNSLTLGSAASGVGLQSSASTTSYTLTLPSAQGSANTVLTNDGNGNLSWEVVSSSGSGNVATGTPGAFAYYSTTAASVSPQSVLFVSGGKIGVGTDAPESLLSVGTNSEFQVDNSGNLVKINGVAYSWPNTLPGSNKILQSDASGNLTWVVDQVGGSGSVSGGTTGFVTTWASSTGLTSGVLRDNGTVAGVNATSSSYTFSIQASSGINPFQITSSTGSSLLSVSQNGRVGIGSSTPIAALSVVGTNVDPFDVSTSTSRSLFHITSRGRVGVGTNNPTEIFEINGCAGCGSSASDNTSINIQGISTGYTNVNLRDAQTGGVNFGIYNGYPSAGYFTIRENGVANRLVIAKTTGNIGIGTSAPGSLLDVYGSLTVGTSSSPTLSVSPSTSTISVNTSTTTSIFTLQGIAGSLPLLSVASSTGSTLFTILANGNLGIGTSTPSGLLAVSQPTSGSTLAPVYIQSASNAVATAIFGNSQDNVVTLLNNRSPGASMKNVISFNDENGAHWYLGSDPNSGGTEDFRLVSNWVGGTPFYALAAGSGGISGKVGIFSTTPAARLSVQGGSGGTIDLFDIASSSGTSYFRVGSSGNVGIGTTGPGSLLSIQGTSTNPTLPLLSVASSTGSTLLTVLANGNVGIGNANPTQSLDVSGSINLTGSISVGSSVLSNNVYGGSNSGNSLTLQASFNNPQTGYVILAPTAGNVAVGTTSATSKFQVLGDIQIGSVATSTAYGLLFNTGSTTNQSQIRITSTTSLASSYALTLPTTTPSAGKALLTDANGSLYWGTAGASASGTPGNIQFAGSSNALNANALFNWDNANLKLSVGTTSTSSTLTLQGAAGSSPLLTISSSTGSTLMTVLANGNVGIGTTTPSALLEVGGKGVFGSGSGIGLQVSEGSYLQIGATAGALPTASYIGFGDSGWTSIYEKYDDAIAIAAGGGPNGNGDVLIAGWDASYNSVQVKLGDISHQDHGHYLNIDSSGVSVNSKLGVGTATPMGVLHVHQDASSTTDTAFYSVDSSTPVLQLGQLPLFSPSANGTYLGLNAPSSFSGNLLHIQGGGSNRLTLSSAGTLNLGGGQFVSSSINLAVNTAPGNKFSNGAINSFTNGNGSWTDSGAFTEQFFAIDPTYNPSSAGLQTNITGMLVSGSWAPSNGNASTTGRWIGLQVAPSFGNGTTAYNSTATAGTLLTGLEVSPTINVRSTSTVGYAALIINPGEVSTSTQQNYLALFQNSSSTKVVITAEGKVGIGTSAPAQTFSVVGNMRLTGALFDANNASGTLGMLLQSTGTGTQWVATSTLGISGGTSASGTPGNIQFYGSSSALNANTLFNWDNSNLKLSIGTTSTSSTISLAAGTTAAEGINFGDASANLYRSAAGTIRTDGIVALKNLATLDGGTFTAVSSNLIRIQGNKPNMTGTEIAAISLEQANMITTAPNSNIQSSFVKISGTFAPTSGTGGINGLSVAPTISQSTLSVGIGITRGLYVNPTLTNAYDFRGLETAAYTATTNQTSLLNNVLFNQPTYATTAAATLANAINLSVSGAPIAGPNMTISSSSAVAIQGGSVSGGGTVTSAYGLYVTAPTGATNNYTAAFLGGNVGIGTSSPNGVLTIHKDASSTASSALYTVDSNTPILQLGSSSLSSPSANGTYLGINAPSGFSGNFFDIQVNGTSKFRVGSTGATVIQGSLSATGLDQVGANTSLLLRGFRSSSAGSIVAITNNGNSMTGTSGTYQMLALTESLGKFAPSSGSAALNILDVLGPTINQNQASSGISRGVHIDPTILRAADFRALDVEGYTYNVSTASTPSILYGSLLRAYTASTTNSTTISDAQLLTLSGAPIAGTNMTLSTSTALYIGQNAVNGGGSVTTSYGLFVNAQAGATNNYAAVFSGGSVGIGSTSPVATLSVVGTASASSTPILDVSSTTSGSMFRVFGDGRIGVNTANPLTLPNAVMTINGNLALGTASTFGNGAIRNVSNIIGSSGSTGNLTLQPSNSLGNVTLAASSNTIILTAVSSSLNVGIGTSTPAQKLHIGSAASGGNVVIANGWLCVDTNDSCTGATASGTVYAVNAYTTGADVAENYPTMDASLAAGDIVSADAGNPVHVSRASSSAVGILGIVSTKPGLLLNGYKSEMYAGAPTVPVALSGRVPVKVTNENGNIKVGDYITLSKKRAGYGVKAKYSTQVVGQALENFEFKSATTTGTILVFVHIGYQNINNVFVLGEDDGQLVAQMNVSGDQQINAEVASTSTATSFLINQKGSGNLLQLQQNGSDRLLIANDGSLNILANATTSTSTIFSVINGTTTMLSINGVGDVAIKGVIVIKDDSFAGSIATNDKGTATITFSYPLGTGKPVIQLTPESDVPVFAQILSLKTDENKNYTGFTIKTFGIDGMPISAAVHYSVVGKQDGYTTSGQVLQVVSSPAASAVITPPAASSSTEGTVAGTSTPDSTLDTSAGESVNTTPAPATEPAVENNNATIAPVSEPATAESPPTDAPATIIPEPDSIIVVTP